MSEPTITGTSEPIDYDESHCVEQSIEIIEKEHGGLMQRLADEQTIKTSCAECEWYGTVGDCDYALRIGGVVVEVNGKKAFTANVEHINRGNCVYYAAKEDGDAKT